MAPSSAQRPSAPIRPLLRIFTAAGLILYGCAKITGAQFHVIESELDRPLRDVSGFWLTWYYFGHFAVYKYFIAICEITAGVLLCRRKSALVGASLASILLLNVVVIRDPTPIDGAWDVSSPAAAQPTGIYFERERAHMCVFVSEGGGHTPHDFEFLARDSSVAIYEKWLVPSSTLLYAGGLQADGSMLVRDARTGAQLTLRRRAGRP